jgi:hypothetical protein
MLVDRKRWPHHSAGSNGLRSRPLIRSWLTSSTGPIDMVVSLVHDSNDSLHLLVVTYPASLSSSFRSASAAFSEPATGDAGGPFGIGRSCLTRSATCFSN